MYSLSQYTRSCTTFPRFRTPITRTAPLSRQQALLFQRFSGHLLIRPTYIPHSIHIMSLRSSFNQVIRAGIQEIVSYDVCPFVLFARITSVKGHRMILFEDSSRRGRRSFSRNRAIPRADSCKLGYSSISTRLFRFFVQLSYETIDHHAIYCSMYGTESRDHDYFVFRAHRNDPREKTIFNCMSDNV